MKPALTIALICGTGLAGCAAGLTLAERIALGLEYFVAAASIIDAATGDPDEPSVADQLLERIDRGIAVYCTLPPESQKLMIEGIDPAVLAVAVRYRGGADGDVCSEE